MYRLLGGTLNNSALQLHAHFCCVLVLLIDVAICLKSLMKFVIIFKGGFQRVTICHAHVNRAGMRSCGSVSMDTGLLRAFGSQRVSILAA